MHIPKRIWANHTRLLIEEQILPDSVWTTTVQVWAVFLYITYVYISYYYISKSQLTRRYKRTLYLNKHLVFYLW